MLILHPHDGCLLNNSFVEILLFQFLFIFNLGNRSPTFGFAIIIYLHPLIGKAVTVLPIEY